MIKFFEIGSARRPGTASYDAIISISKPLGAASIPGLRTVKGSKSELVLSKSGSKWTDCLSPEFSHLPLVWSQRVIETIQRANLKGLKWMELECDTKKNKKLATRDHPYYYEVIPIGQSLRFTKRVFEKIDGHYELRFETADPADERLRYKPKHYVQVCPIMDSWDGSDFMIAGLHRGGLLPFGGFYCSRRVVELAHCEQWSNFTFTPADRLGMCMDDFRERPWPPEQWYPENHPPSIFANQRSEI